MIPQYLEHLYVKEQSIINGNNKISMFQRAAKKNVRRRFLRNLRRLEKITVSEYIFIKKITKI